MSPDVVSKLVKIGTCPRVVKVWKTTTSDTETELIAGKIRAFSAPLNPCVMVLLLNKSRSGCARDLMSAAAIRVAANAGAITHGMFALNDRNPTISTNAIPNGKYRKFENFSFSKPAAALPR